MGEKGKQSVFGELKPTLRLAWPIVIGNLGQILIGLVDTWMIGKVGVAELGAAAFVNNLFVIPLVAGMGLLTAVPVLVSQAKGGGKLRLVGRFFKHALALTLVVSAATTGLLAANALLLDQYGQPIEVIAVSRGYYWLIVASLLPALIYQCLKGVSEGLGWSNPPMAILLSGIALNVFLNWVFIFGNWGAPALGLDGAGLATLIARWLIAVGMLAYVLKAARFRSCQPRRWRSGYAWSYVSRLLRLGLPAAGQHLFEVGAFAGAGIMIGWLSKEALAAHQIAITWAALAFMIPLGVSVACGIRVGEAVGSRNTEKVRQVCLGAIGFTFVQTAAVATLFLLFGESIARRFVNDEIVIELAGAMLVVVGLFEIFDGAQVTCLGALRGMSDVNVPMIITFVAYWALALPLGYVLGIRGDLGAVGVWVGLALGLLFAAGCLLARLRLMLTRLSSGNTI